MTNTKNNLPERMYYPIADAAIKLNCSIGDIIHYGAVGIIDVCIYVNLYSAPDGMDFALFIPANYLNLMDGFGMIREQWWSIDFVTPNHHDESNCNTHHYAKAINGFFYMPRFFLTSLEFDVQKKIRISSLSTSPNKFENAGVDIFIPPDNHLLIGVDKLCIKSQDIENIRAVGAIALDSEVLSKAESDKTVAKKGELITSLLQMIPEMADVNLENEKITKIVSIIESIAAKKGIDLPATHWQTWQKYLGR